MTKIFVGVGSNLGDREFLIRKAVEAMRDLSGFCGSSS